MWEGKKKIAWSMRSKDNERTACKPLVLKLIPITFHKEQFKKICLQNFALEKAAWELCSRIPMFMHACGTERNGKKREGEERACRNAKVF